MVEDEFLLPCCARDYISFILSIIFWISWLYWSQLSKWGWCLIVERLISLSLSLSENQFILYQFLVEWLLISFERIWKFKFSWFVNCPQFEINKKKIDIVVRVTYVHFNLPTTFSNKFDFFVWLMFAQCKRSLEWCSYPEFNIVFVLFWFARLHLCLE